MKNSKSLLGKKPQHLKSMEDITNYIGVAIEGLDRGEVGIEQLKSISSATGKMIGAQKLQLDANRYVGSKKLPSFLIDQQEDKK